MSNINSFDAAAFGISHQEALALDPQQRLLLEATWECLGDAGYSGTSLRGQSVGVYVGAYAQDWLLTLASAGERVNAAAGTGTSLAILANRLSYLLDVTGPSMLVDTACSSSLTGIHLALQALEQGECDRALVAGVSLSHEPTFTALMRASLPISATERCRPFDSEADGIVRGEGVVVFLLERSEVSRGGRHGSILGSALGHGGRTNGITAPSASGQAATMRRALARAQVPAESVRYVEAHGTGTILGDPIEASALRSVYAHPNRSCFVGSVKGAFGHLEAAAGAVGLLNGLLVARHGVVPPQQGFAQENPAVDLKAHGLLVSASVGAIQADPGAYLTAVSSVGFGGSIAHVVLAPPQEVGSRIGAEETREGSVLLLSATSEEAVISQREAVRIHIDNLTVADAGEYAARQSRVAASMPRRLAWAGRDAHGLRSSIRRDAGGDPTRRTHEGAGVVMVFSGQGATWHAMGEELWQLPWLRTHVERWEAEVLDITGWSLTERLAGDADVDTQSVQICTAAVQLAIVELLSKRGIQPLAVVGHSMGEVTAAIVSGAMTSSEGFSILAARAETIEAVARGGAMASISLDAASVAAMIADLDGTLTISAINSPTTTVVAGDSDAINVLTEVCGELGVKLRKLPVDYGFHGPTLKGCQVATPDIAKTPTLPWVSTVFGEQVESAPDSAYWAANVSEPVNLVGAVGRAIDLTGASTVLEVAPRPVLAGDLSRTVDLSVAVVATMTANSSPAEWLPQTVIDLFRAGVPVDAAELIGCSPTPGPVLLPSWQRSTYWPGEIEQERRSHTREEARIQTAVQQATTTVGLTELAEFIATKVADALDDFTEDSVPLEVPLATWDLSSLTVVSIRNAVEARFGVTAPLPILLRADLSPLALAGALGAAPKTERPQNGLLDLLSRVDELNDDEVVDLLQKLARGKESL